MRKEGRKSEKKKGKKYKVREMWKRKGEKKEEK
jgi:hypothetical protein